MSRGGAITEGNVMGRSFRRGFAGAVALSVLALSSWTAPAAAADAALTPQQQRMSMCAKQNKGKKGDDYKQAQSACLKGDDTAAAAPMTPQQKMASCARQNKGKKGDDYKKAQSDCLKG